MDASCQVSSGGLTTPCRAGLTRESTLPSAWGYWFPQVALMCVQPSLPSVETLMVETVEGKRFEIPAVEVGITRRFPDVYFGGGDDHILDAVELYIALQAHLQREHGVGIYVLTWCTCK